MSLYQLSKRIDRRYEKLTPNAKSLIFIGIIFLLLLLLGLFGWFLYDKNRQYADSERYIKELEESKQNYYLVTIANSNLEKRLQDLSLRLAETLNNTIELERMFKELEAENVSLEEIRDAMEKGLIRTKTQLDNMRGSVNYLIDQRQKDIIQMGEKVKIEKTNTHGKY